MLRATMIGVGLVLGFCVAAEANEPREHIVRVVSDYKNLRIAFSPKTLVIQPGDTVTWVNEAAEDHNIVSYPDGFPKGAKPLSSPYLKKQGARWSYTFSVRRTYEYRCISHIPMGMHGSIIVSRPSTVDEFHVPTVTEMRRYAKRLQAFFSDDEFKFRPRNRTTDAVQNSKDGHPNHR